MIRAIACPVCKTSELRPAEADAHLASLRCITCGGQWVRGEQYYQWIDRGGSAPSNASPEPVGEVADNPRAKLCPECGTIMRRYNVGQGVSFAIDRCGTCAGIWFDRGEWETLAARQLHDRVHFVFSHAWQADLLRQNLQASARQRLLSRIGQQDFDELQRVMDWVERHPHRDEIVGHLVEHLRATEAAARRRPAPTTAAE